MHIYLIDWASLDLKQEGERDSLLPAVHFSEISVQALCVNEEGA